MKILWDELKRKANILKHGYDFADFTLDWFAGAYIEQTHSKRFKAIVSLSDGTVVVIFAALGSEAISLISIRLARKDEKALIS
jgi:uncharacterized protein